MPLVQAGFVRKQGSNTWNITLWEGTWLASGELDMEQKSWCSCAPRMRNLQLFIHPLIYGSWMDGHHWCLSTAWPRSVIPSPEEWGGHSWAAKRSRLWHPGEIAELRTCEKSKIKFSASRHCRGSQTNLQRKLLQRGEGRSNQAVYVCLLLSGFKLQPLQFVLPLEADREQNKMAQLQSYRSLVFLKGSKT